MIKKILYIVLLAFCVASCTEKIDLKLDTSYSRLVVDGNIEEGTGAYQIALTKSSGYFSNEAAPRVVNAHVSINDGTNTFEERTKRAEEVCRLVLSLGIELMFNGRPRRKPDLIKI